MGLLTGRPPAWTSLHLLERGAACKTPLLSVSSRSISSLSMETSRRNAWPAAGIPSTGSPVTVFGPLSQQVRCAGRKGGYKRKKKAMRTRTVHQRGLGKRMEFFWPQHDAHRTRVPLYENSRRHVIWDHRMKKWMVMWYRHGIQVFRSFSAKGSKFEQGRARAILFFQQLQNYGKLGRPKPDQCRSGVRGVYFDKEEKAWVARWSNCGMKTHAVFGTQELGFQTAYREAVRTRVQSVRQNHQFMFQRTRWKGQRRPLGTPQT
eukprot:TRINITY_DN108213_c0_g1_i1.p1 TRINITY_DN108213_c0_g1~~TRINITY_DN108213_c0_g1_i1.p1  ORF type:complete len:295 (+),score=36.97 TRINITY_DN108213_c0_g1_i1:101-886(+)